MKLRFGEFLIKKGLIDHLALVQALNIQRRRGFIPIGEIALHDKLISAENLLNILDIQENTARRFGDIAIEFGYLTKAEIDLLCKKQTQLHSHIGEILVEMNKLTTDQLVVLLSEFKEKQANASNESEDDVEAFQDINPGDAPTKVKTGDVLSAVVDIDPELVFESIVKCPICDKDSSQRVIGNLFFDVNEHDVDLKPAVFEWKVNLNADLYPDLYQIWSCPFCSFTTEAEDFEDPTKNIAPSLSNFRKKVKEVVDSETFSVLIGLLFEFTGDDSFMIAIKKYLVSIYLYKNVFVIRQQEAVPLANLYLHLAWILRELQEREELATYEKKLEELKGELSHIWHDMPITEVELLNLAIESYYTALNKTATNDDWKQCKLTQLIARIYIRINRPKEARKILLDILMIINRNTARLKSTLKPDVNEFNKLHNKKIMKDLCRNNEFAKETKDLIELCLQMIKWQN
jgi:uncharacterized protein (DUF2225 family)